MDKYLFDKYFTEFENKNIIVDNYVRDKLGLKKINTFIRVDDLYIYCIPVELSLKKCKIILILNEKEISIFKDKKNKLRLHLKFDNEFLPSKEASFFLWIKYINAEKIMSLKNGWKVDFEINSISCIYHEVIIKYFLKQKTNMDIYHNKKSKLYKRSSFNELCLKEIASINNEKCLILKISLEKIYLLINKHSIVLNDLKDSIVTVKLFAKDTSFYINGSTKTINELNKIPGVSVAELEIEYSPYLFDLIAHS